MDEIKSINALKSKDLLRDMQTEPFMNIFFSGDDKDTISVEDEIIEFAQKANICDFYEALSKDNQTFHDIVENIIQGNLFPKIESIKSIITLFSIDKNFDAEDILKAIQILGSLNEHVDLVVSRNIIDSFENKIFKISILIFYDNEI